LRSKQEVAKLPKVDCISSRNFSCDIYGQLQ